MSMTYPVILLSPNRRQLLRNSLSKPTIHILTLNISCISPAFTAHVLRMLKITYVAFGNKILKALKTHFLAFGLKGLKNNNKKIYKVTR